MKTLQQKWEEGMYLFQDRGVNDKTLKALRNAYFKGAADMLNSLTEGVKNTDQLVVNLRQATLELGEFRDEIMKGRTDDAGGTLPGAGKESPEG